ncbi:MAG: hypothetical protein KGJ36_01890 [Acidobacteriota bacterium]|nr:hypothetical protein [Acidobacteriota bacterium]
MGLGSRDADARWIGIRRHQAVLAVGGLGLVGDGLIRARAPLAELVLGPALLLGAVPWLDGLTVAGAAATLVGYLLRRRWGAVDVARDHSGVTIAARGRVCVHGYALAHVGRLDLAGLDHASAAELGLFVDALATSGDDRHVSLHVRSSRGGVVTALAVDGAASAPPNWVRDDAVIGRVIDAPAPSSPYLERWGYVRVRDGVRAVLRVRDFTAAPPGSAVLARAQLASDLVTVAVHLEVVGTTRARRYAERAVHRVRSDGATTAAAGYRRTARVERAAERLAEREVSVAAGRALLRVAVFVTVRAESLVELVGEVARVQRALRDSGLVAERGRGRQGAWWCAQLPGGPGW